MKRKRITLLAVAAGAAIVAAVMSAGPARADTVPTTTTLTLASSRVVEGFESSFAMSIGVDAGTGSWVIEAGSPTFPTTVLCGGDVATSTTCFMSPGALPPGNYNVLAIYAGNENFSESASGLESLTVIAQQPTITNLTMPSSTVTVGHEDLDPFSFTVTGDTGNPAQGTVTILAGSQAIMQCTNVFVSSGGGPGVCRMTASELNPGTYPVTANFDGLGGNFANSTSAPPISLTVLALQSTSTSLALSPPSLTFGSGQAETLIATVTPATSGTPTGNVTVMSGSKPLCTIALAGPTGKCTLSALTQSQLTPGSYPLTATYNGDDTYATSSDTSQTLVVAKEPTTTSLTLSADTIAVGGEQAELFTVQVTPATSGTPTGNVTVKAGATAVCTIILANGTGNCSLTSRQLARGSYQVTATYNSDTTYASSTSSPPQALTVNRR